MLYDTDLHSHMLAWEASKIVLWEPCLITNFQTHLALPSQSFSSTGKK